MHELAAHIHWWKNALPGVIILLGLAMLAIPLWKLMVRQFIAERCAVIGYNSIANQFKDAKAQEVQLTAPQPPDYFTAKMQVYFRTGQLNALADIQRHNHKLLERVQRQGMRRKNKRK
jgi:hypothetical protein